MANRLKRKKQSDESILVICAHSDDQIFGPGGTVAKYAKEGKKVYSIIFSYGEMSHPFHLKQHTATARVKEAQDVDKYIGGSGVIFLGLNETRFLDEFKAKKMYSKLKKLIIKYNPTRVFTHSIDDPVSDHRAVNKLVVDTLDRMKFKCDVYMFDVWNLFNFKKTDYVRIIVDVSGTFKNKIKALRMFKSQGVARFSLMWSVYFRAWILARKINVRYAEVFYKIR